MHQAQRMLLLYRTPLQIEVHVLVQNTNMSPSSGVRLTLNHDPIFQLLKILTLLIVITKHFFANRANEGNLDLFTFLRVGGDWSHVCCCSLEQVLRKMKFLTSSALALADQLLPDAHDTCHSMVCVLLSTKLTTDSILSLPFATIFGVQNFFTANIFSARTARTLSHVVTTVSTL